MNLSKFLIIIFVVTLLASFYVHQQVRIVQLAYQEQKKLAYLNRLIDENSNLRYNINRQSSLVSMAGLWQNGDFEWPRGEQIVSLRSIQKTPEDSRQIQESESILVRLFQLRSQAEATPVKPR